MPGYLFCMPSIRSRRVVLDNEVRPATITFDAGVIVAVDDRAADVDFGDLAILPGLVDSHVHVNEPGRTDWEGFATATRAAAAGGTTTVVDMPLNSIPPTVDAVALEEKVTAAEGQCHVDVAFWGGIVPGSEASIGGLLDAGVCGFKVFLVDSGVPEFPPLSVPDLTELIPRLGGRPVLLHAEDPAHLLAHVGDRRSYAAFLSTRPGAAERAAIESVAEAWDAVGENAAGPAHILHVSGGEAVDAIRSSQHRLGLTAETCPHYLTFAADEIPDGATSFKCTPPIRSRVDREALWDALAEGVLAMVVSDHSPAPPALKDPAGGDLIEAWGGIASLELRLPATWHGAQARGHGLDRLAAWLANAPARLAGLDDRKGTIAPGYDADFAVFDPDGATTVDARLLHQRHPVTPYDGMTLSGGLVATYLAGVPVFGPDAHQNPGGRLLRRGG